MAPLTMRAFFIGVILAVAVTGEVIVLLAQVDRRRAGLPIVPRWRLAFSGAVIVGGVLWALRIGGY